VEEVRGGNVHFQGRGGIEVGNVFLSLLARTHARTSIHTHTHTHTHTPATMGDRR
jgi:hypothetical protein